MDVSYFLDFKNSLDLGRTSFGESYNLRDKQKKILDDLEKRIDPIVRGVLEGRFDLFERDITIKLVSDDGLSFDFTKRDGIFKKISSPPKRSRNFVRSRVGED